MNAARWCRMALGLVALGCAERSIEFSAPEIVSAATGVGAAPMFAVSDDGREAVAWVTADSGGTNGHLLVRVDRGEPVELVDPLGPIQPHGEAPPKLAWSRDGSLHALYVVGKVVPGRRFPVSALRHTRSRDGGRSWDHAVTITDDTLVFGSHNFHALHAAANGDAIAAWLDGREGRSAAFLARSSDGGATWGKNARLSVGEACPCCRTAIASRPDGAVWVAWRTVMPGNIRDIVVARSRDGGATFEEAKRVHADDWVFDACPHAGPSLLADSLGRVHIAWWTGKEGRSGVWYARADDGETFSAPQPLSALDAARPIHVQLAVEGKLVVAVWDDVGAGAEPPSVVVRISRDGGDSFAPMQALSAPGIAATFPVVGLADGRLTVAWTQKATEEHRHDEASRLSMRDPTAVMGLPAVGEASVIVRRASISRGRAKDNR